MCVCACVYVYVRVCEYVSGILNTENLARVECDDRSVNQNELTSNSCTDMKQPHALLHTTVK